MSQSKSTTQQSSTSAIDPRYSDAAWQNYGNAQNAMEKWSPTAIPTPQAFNQQQLDAQNMATGVAQQDPNGGYFGQAGQLFTQAGNYKPLNVAAQTINAPTMGDAAQGVAGTTNGQGYSAQTGTAAKIDPSTIAMIKAGVIDPSKMNAADLAKYEAMIDPTYTNGVVNRFLSDNDRARQMAQQPNATAAAQAGAFGGTRQAVLESLTNEAYGRTAADTTANLRLNEYNQGLSNYQSDLARQQAAAVQNAANNLTAAQSNQGVQFGTANTNANLAQQMGIANMDAQNRAGEFSANAGNQANLVNAQLGTQTSLANAQSRNAQALAQAQMAMQAGMTNAGNDLSAQGMNQDAGYKAANLGLSAGSNLLGLGQQVRSNTIDNANLLSQVGQQNYDLTAAQQQAAYQNAVNQANAPLLRNQFLQGSLGAVPYGTSTTGNATTTTSPSLLSSILQIGGMGLQLAAPKLIPKGA